MKLFQQLLVAPAALGLLAPMAANAAELNINGVSNYSASSEEVKSISQFSDVYPTDWAYQALTNLAERHGCVAGNPDGSITRYEAAALLNNCLGNVAQVNDEERRLINEFGPELAAIKGRIDGLEAGIGAVEAGQFSTTTKLSGTTKFVAGAASEVTEGEEVHMNYDTILSLTSSFTGRDLLVTNLRAGNFSSTPWAGSAALETNFDSSDQIKVNRNYYQFPIGDDVTATLGAVVRQDDMLAVWPSDYPGDTVLDVMTYAGANAAYNLSLGAGAGLSYSKDGFSASLAYVGTDGSDASKGLLTDEGADDVTVQVAYTGEEFGAALAYTSSDEDSGDYDAFGVSGYWTPAEGGAIPSVSGGFGTKNPDEGDDEFTWTIGLQWNDLGAAGNTLGFGLGSAEAWVDDSDDDEPMAYELWYQIAVSDNVTVTPALFTIEQDGDDISGALVKTTFSF